MSAERNRISGFLEPLDDRQLPQPVSITPAASQRRRFWPWPGMIFALLGINISIVGLTAFLALSDSSFAIEPDYYRKAMQWDQTALQRERNSELGWTVESPPSPAGLPVVLRLRDRDGAAVSGAKVEVIAFHNAHAGDRLQTTLSEIEPGMYRSNEALIRTGQWQLRIVAQRGDELFTAEQAHAVSAREGSP